AGGAMRLTGEEGAPALLVLVTPLPDQARTHFGPGFALIALRSVSDRPRIAATTLTALFQLSPTQAEIALALHEGRTPEDIAAERGVRISTLRTHLAEIYLRTGAENQRELVRLLGMLPPVG